MEEILNKEVREATKKKFDEDLENKVKLFFFTQEPKRLIAPEHLKGQECLFCKETRQLLTEVCSLSEKISLEIYDFQGDKDMASGYGVDKIPATLVLGEKDYGLRFFGIPSGYEYTSLIESTEFPHLAQKYSIFGVPKTIINETISIDGAVPEETFLENVLKATTTKEHQDSK